MKPLLLLWCVALLAEQLPKIAGENLLGKPVELPAAAAGHIAILILGFTHASQSQTKAWSQRLAQEFPDSAPVTTYSLAVLEDVPRLVRGMAVHGISSGVPKEQRDRFLLVYRDEAELKQIAGFDRPDDAYLLLLDRGGEVRWRFHGALSDSADRELAAQIQKLDEK